MRKLLKKYKDVDVCQSNTTFLMFSQFQYCTHVGEFINIVLSIKIVNVVNAGTVFIVCHSLPIR